MKNILKRHILKNFRHIAGATYMEFMDGRLEKATKENIQKWRRRNLETLSTLEDRAKNLPEELREDTLNAITKERERFKKLEELVDESDIPVSISKTDETEKS